MLLSRHPSASFYDLRQIVNVHEARHQFHRLPPNGSVYKINIDRELGHFHASASNNQRVTLPIPAITWTSWCVSQQYRNDTTTRLINLDLQCHKFQTLDYHEGFELQQDALGILCITRENVDGGILEIGKIKRELSPGFAALFTIFEPHVVNPVVIKPIRSYDGRNEATVDVFILGIKN